MTNFEDVVKFHKKFGLGMGGELPFEPGPREVSEEWLKFRIKFLREEFDEFVLGFADKDDAQMADALIDLTYVAMGTALGMGYPWQQLWEEVHAANMRKVNAAVDGSDSKRGSAFDVVKPPGWKGPRIKTILEWFGWNATQTGC